MERWARYPAQTDTRFVSGVGQVPCPCEARGQAGSPRVAQLVKVRRSGCDLGLFRVERIPLLPYQAAICPLVVTDGPQKRDRQQHSECPWHLLLHLEWRIAGLSTTRHIYGALSGASRPWPCRTRHTRGTTMAVELLTERLSSPLFLPSFLLGY